VFFKKIYNKILLLKQQKIKYNKIFYIFYIFCKKNPNSWQILLGRWPKKGGDNELIRRFSISIIAIKYIKIKEKNALKGRLTIE
jgi:hypothetical protein